MKKVNILSHHHSNLLCSVSTIILIFKYKSCSFGYISIFYLLFCLAFFLLLVMAASLAEQATPGVEVHHSLHTHHTRQINTVVFYWTWLFSNCFHLQLECLLLWQAGCILTCSIHTSLASILYQDPFSSDCGHLPHVQCHSSMRSRPDRSHRPDSTLLQGPMQQLVISKSTKLHICTDLGYQLHPNILVPQKLSYMTEPLVPTIVWAAGIEPGNALHVKL